MKLTEKIMLGISAFSLVLILFILGISQSDTPIPIEGENRIKFIQTMTDNFNSNKNPLIPFNTQDFNDPKFFEVMNMTLKKTSSNNSDESQNYALKDEKIRQAQILEEKLIEEKMKRVESLRQGIYQETIFRKPASLPSAIPKNSEK